MYLCILDQDGTVLLHKNIHAQPDPFLKAIEPYRDDIVVAVECKLGGRLFERTICIAKTAAAPT